jgi:hypothetical protein
MEVGSTRMDPPAQSRYAALGALAVGLLLLSFASVGCGGGTETTSTAPVASGSGETDQTVALPAAEAADARKAGQQACDGMTPLEAAKHFEEPARRAGVDKDFAKFVAEPSAATVNSPGYPRLVAATYASTLPVKQRPEAAAGCAESLASRSSGGQGSSKRATRQGPSATGGPEEKGSN